MVVRACSHASPSQHFLESPVAPELAKEIRPLASRGGVLACALPHLLSVPLAVPGNGLCRGAAEESGVPMRRHPVVQETKCGSPCPFPCHVSPHFTRDAAPARRGGWMVRCPFPMPSLAATACPTTCGTPRACWGSGSAQRPAAVSVAARQCTRLPDRATAYRGHPTRNGTARNGPATAAWCLPSKPVFSKPKTSHRCRCVCPHASIPPAALPGVAAASNNHNHNHNP